MPKMKTKSAAKKRFKVTANGKIKRSCSGAYVDATQEKTVKTLIYNK